MSEDHSAATPPKPAGTDAGLPALIEEACRKSAVLWLTAPGGRAWPAWHIWHDGAVVVVAGGGEQPLPDLEGDGALTALVTVRSKDKGGRLVTWEAHVSRLVAGTAPWHAATTALAAERLNAVDTDAQRWRWAAASSVLRLEPTGVVPEHPGSMPAVSHAAAPVPTPATTRGPLPYVLGRGLGTRIGRWLRPRRRTPR